MKLSTLFRLEENLNLDKKTLTILRWIAIIGQFFAINFVYYYLKLDFPIFICTAIILVGFTTNIYLQYKIKGNQNTRISGNILFCNDNLCWFQTI